MNNCVETVDAAIVGAGPAGALLGYYLARYGLRVLLIDKKRFPRYKACGGGLTVRALGSLPFDVSSVVEDTTCHAKMLYQGRLLNEVQSEFPLIAMVMRDRFDHFLARRAEAEGVIFRDGVALKSIEGTPGRLTLSTSSGPVRARIIAGADGVNSRVAKMLGLRVKSRYMAAVEGEITSRRPMDVERFKGSVHYDFGVIPQGYGWVFPKQDHLSVGVGTFSPDARGWQRYFYDYLVLKGLQGCRKLRPTKGHLIPVRPHRENRLSCRKGLVLGDAAGYCDPLTGEGLVFAIQQARMASEAILQALDTGYTSLEGFTRRVREAYHADSVAASIMADMLYSFPVLGRKILATHALDLAENQLRVICGDLSYAELGKHLLFRMLNPSSSMPVFFA